MKENLINNYGQFLSYLLFDKMNIFWLRNSASKISNCTYLPCCQVPVPNPSVEEVLTKTGSCRKNDTTKVLAWRCKIMTGVSFESAIDNSDPPLGSAKRKATPRFPLPIIDRRYYVSLWWLSTNFQTQPFKGGGSIWKPTQRVHTLWKTSAR